MGGWGALRKARAAGFRMIRGAGALRTQSVNFAIKLGPIEIIERIEPAKIRETAVSRKLSAAAAVILLPAVTPGPTDDPEPSRLRAWPRSFWVRAAW